MSGAPPSARSFEIIETADLIRLAAIAQARIDAGFRRHPAKRALYEGRLLGLCLCQGAADHFLRPDKSAGVHDFDLWAFFARPAGASLWNRKPFTADFGPSKFGRSPLDPAKYVGRRVDVLWRDIAVRMGEAPTAAIRRYFEEPHTASARALQAKAAVLVWPDDQIGEILWRPRLSSSAA